MIIVVTSLRLRKLWHYFKLTYLVMHIVRQLKSQQGFVSMRNTGFGYMHYTLSVWESEEEMKRFARSGAHQQAMKQSRSIATEIGTYAYQSDQAPDWKQAKRLLVENGKFISF